MIECGSTRTRAAHPPSWCRGRAELDSRSAGGEPIAFQTEAAHNPSNSPKHLAHSGAW